MLCFFICTEEGFGMAKSHEADSEQLIIDFFPEARISSTVVAQLKPCLPIKSFDALSEALGEIEIEGRKLPIEAFRGHVRDDLFPIKSVADLVEKVCGGVRDGLEVMRSPSFPIRRPELEAIQLSSAPRRRAGARISGLARR
jgi:hypothetical protein